MNYLKVIDDKIRNLFLNMEYLWIESQDVYDAHWKSDANTTISAVTNSTDPVTVNSKLTKAEYLAGITLCEQLTNFFGNSAVTQSDYNKTIQNIIYGNDAAVGELSTSVESIGDRLKSLSEIALAQYKEAKDILELYNDNGISTQLSGVSAGDNLGCMEYSKELLTSYIVFIQQYVNMIGNAAVSTGDYRSTLSKRQR